MTIAAILGQLLLGWLAADLLGGIVHWWEDRAAEVHWPVLGRYIVAPNREHHQSPQAFTRTSFLARNLLTMLAAGAIALLWLWTLGPSLTLAAAAIGGMVQNQVHFWAHNAQGAPGWVRVLQDVGLLQSPRQHGDHHRLETRRYCILTNFLNPPLDALRIWDGLEIVLGRLGIPVNGGTR